MKRLQIIIDHPEAQLPPFRSGRHLPMQPNKPSMTEALALNFSTKVRSFERDQLHTLISCSKTKGGHREVARHMYTSPLYRKSVLLTERWKIPYSILSAKYGLIGADEVIEPYELTLKGASKTEKLDWARKVHQQLENLRGKKLIVLAGDDYLAPLVETAGLKGLDYFAPLEGLSLGNRLAFLNDAIRIERRRTEITEAYQLFEKLASKNNFHRLRDLLSSELPTHGVYFFFDENEPTEFSKNISRLVRVGTHGVSLGSTATLRNRLRAIGSSTS